MARKKREDYKKYGEEEWLWFWNGKEISTVRDVQKACRLIRSKKEAAKFVSGYLKSTPNVDFDHVINEVTKALDAVFNGKKLRDKLKFFDI